MSRTRSSTSGLTPSTASYVLQTVSGIHGTPERITANGTYNTSWYPEITERVMVDEVTSNWKQRRNRGEVINNPMTSSRTVTTDVQLTLDYAALNKTLCPYSDGEWLINGTKIVAGKIPMSFYGTSWQPLPTVDVDWLKAVAITSAWAKAQSSEILAGATIGEGSETIRSMVSLTRRFLRIGRAIRRGKIKGLKSEFTLKELADRWMEGRYFIRPLVYDILGTIKAFQADKDPRRVKFKSMRGDSAQSLWTGNLVSNANYTIAGTKSSWISVTAKSGVLAALDAVSDASIWGLNQPFETLWELTPFSFVVDWFFNVGKTIAAWTPNPGIHALASWTVVETLSVQTIQVTGSVSNGTCSYANTYSLSPGTRSRIVTQKTRIVNPNLPIVPSCNIRLDAAKLLDLVIMGKKFFKR